jgi:3-isopropylmalate/(R)-2-methylmalate dehydratase large subunit
MQVAGATYKAMEFSGDALDAMNMDERMTVCNMAVEAGAKNGVIAPDQTTFDYVDTRAPGYSYTPLYADEGATYTEEFTIDVSKLEPLVAAPHSPDNRKTARECSSVAIDRVYIGSCTGVQSSAHPQALHVLSRRCSTE